MNAPELIVASHAEFNLASAIMKLAKKRVLKGLEVYSHAEFSTV